MKLLKKGKPKSDFYSVNYSYSLQRENNILKKIIIFLLLIIVSSLFVSCSRPLRGYSYCELGEDEYYDITTSIDSFLDDQYTDFEDASTTLYCYFEDEGITFESARNSYSAYQIYNQSITELLNDIYKLLEENYVEEN